MFTITTEDEAQFLEFCENNYIYRGAQYVFTFDERFWVYYYKQHDNSASENEYRYVYIALDTKTGRGSQFISTEDKYRKSEYDTLVPNILNALKYLGEAKYLINPLELAKQ